MKRIQLSVAGIRLLSGIGVCLHLTGCALEDIENFSSAMTVMNHELGCGGSTYGSDASPAASSYDSNFDATASTSTAQTTLDDEDYSTSDTAQERSPASAIQNETASVSKTAESSLVHVYAIAYGKNACGMETALGYEHAVVDAESVVSEKRRLENSLQSRYSGVTRCRSSSSLYDHGKSAKAVMLITWQSGTEKCPTNVYSYAYGVSIEDADAKAKQLFKRWAPASAEMHTVDLSRFAQ